MKVSEMILQLQNMINKHGDFEIISFEITKQGDDEGNVHDPLFESDLDEDEVIENGETVGVIY